MAINHKQRTFVEEYVIDFNRTRAYKLAYPNCKTDNTANCNASKLLKKKEIQDAIDELLSKVTSKRIADATEVMEYLTRVMRREEKEHVVVTVFEEKNGYEIDENGVPRRTSQKKEIPVTVEIPTKVSDANKASELLGKRYKMFSEVSTTELVLPKFEGEGLLE